MPAPVNKLSSSATQAIAEKIRDLEEAHRQFKKATRAIAKKQRDLLSHVQGLLDHEKIQQLLQSAQA